MKLRLIYIFTIVVLLLNGIFLVKAQNLPRKQKLQSVEKRKADVIYINCDSVYGNKNYRLVLTPISTDQQNEENYEFVFQLFKMTNRDSIVIYNDTIISTAQEINFADFNGDNVKDILIQNSSDVRSNWTYYLYLVDLVNDTLQKIEGFNEIKNPKYLKKYNLIDNYVNSGKNWTSLYKIKGDTVLDMGVVIYDDQTENSSYQRDLKDAIEKIIKNEKNNR
jgi:hypothetical protein